MKIACKVASQLAGFYSTFHETGHQWLWWTNQPAFDVFDEFHPDLILVGSEDIPGLDSCIEEFKPHVIKVSGDSVQLNNITKPLPPLVDHRAITRVNVNPDLVSDICYLGEKSIPLLQLCHPLGRYKIKITGSKNWPVPNYIGEMTGKNVLELFSSSTIMYAATIEDSLLAAACSKCFITGSTEVDEFWSETNLEVYGNTHEERCRIVDAYLKKPESAEYVGGILYDIAVPNYTYSKFIVECLDDLGLAEEAQHVRDAYHFK